MSENERDEKVAAGVTVTESAGGETQAQDTETQVQDTEAAEEQVQARVEGDKELAVNHEAMAIEGEKAEVPDKPAVPSFFVKKDDRHRVEVDILCNSLGRIVSVSRKGLALDFKKEFPYLTHQQIWFEFSLPNYEDMSTYRQRSASWKREAQQTVVDKLSLRNFLLVWHLKDWSLTDEKGNKVALEHEDTGALTDDSVSRVYAVSPTLIDVVLTMFEKDILLS